MRLITVSLGLCGLFLTLSTAWEIRMRLITVSLGLLAAAATRCQLALTPPVVWLEASSILGKPACRHAVRCPSTSPVNRSPSRCQRWLARW